MKKLINILFILLLFCQISHAEEVKKTGIELVDLSFEQAYQLMLENNNQLKAYNEAIETKKYEKRATLGEFSPKIVLNSTYIHFSDDIKLTTPVNLMGMNLNTVTNIQNQNLFTFSGGVVWNIFTGGKMLSNHAAARGKLEATNAKYKEVKDTLTVELVKRYYGLRLAQDVADVRQESMKCIEHHLKDAEMLEKEGFISRAERLHADVAYSNATRDYNNSIKDVNIAEEGLKALIKAPEANLKGVRIEPNSELFMHKDFSIDSEQMKENALKNNPQLKQIQEKRKIMDAKYHAQVADYMPTVSLFATDILGASNLSEAVPRASFGGTANWAIFNGLKRENNTIAIRHERKMVDYELEDAKNNIEALANKQYQELMKYKENYDSLATTIEKAKEALRVATLAFKEGFGTSLQVTDAQMILRKAQTERLEAIYNFNVALTDLLKTNGDTAEIFNYISKEEKL